MFENNNMDSKRSVVNGYVSKDVRMDGKTVLITGANVGIGYETATDCASRGARVLMACRDAEKCRVAIDTIQERVPGALLIPIELNLASLDSVRKCAELVIETEDRLDVLVNNAGIMSCPQWKTEDGFEMQIGVNHIGHFLLTNLLLDLLKKSSPSRIVVVSSMGHESGRMNWDDLMHEKNYRPFPVYCQSKLANVLFSRELSRKLEGTGVTCNSLHPGLVMTQLGRHFFNKENCMNATRYYLAYPIVKMVGLTPHKGAQTSIFCSVAPELSGTTGKYFAKCKIKAESTAAQSDEDAARLWEQSLKWVGME